MSTENWIAGASAAVAIVAAMISLTQARHAKAQTESAAEQTRLARQQLDQAERAHREQNEPYVIVDIQPDAPGSGLLVLIIENVGTTVARDVKITANPPLASATSEAMTDRLRRGLSRTIPMLPPKRRLKYAFDVSPTRFSSDLPTAYTFTVEARGPFGDVEPAEYLVDISSWQETLLGERTNARVEKALESVATNLGALGKSFREANASSIRQNDEVARTLLRQELEGDR